MRVNVTIPNLAGIMEGAVDPRAVAASSAGTAGAAVPGEEPDQAFMQVSVAPCTLFCYLDISCTWLGWDADHELILPLTRWKRQLLAMERLMRQLPL